mgnify:CR=1 FL=1
MILNNKRISESCLSIIFFILTIIITIHIPIYFAEDYVFIGWVELLSVNIIPIVCLLGIIGGFVSYFDFKYVLKDATNMPFSINKIENINYPENLLSESLLKNVLKEYFMEAGNTFQFLSKLKKELPQEKAKLLRLDKSLNDKTLTHLQNQKKLF